MSTGAYLGGVVWFLAIWGAALATAAVLLRRRLPHLRGATAVLAYSLIATIALIAAHVIPTALTVLTRGTVVIASALLLLAALRVPRVRTETFAGSYPGTRADRHEAIASRLIAAAAVAVVLVAELTSVRQHFALPAYGVDALNFHLPDAAGWLRSGSLWHVGQFTPDLANGNYPNNGNMLLLAAILPWHADFLVRFVFLPFLALAGIGVYALGRELGAPRTAAAVLGAMFVAIPAVSYDVMLNTLPDIVMIASFATGLVFLVRHTRTDRTSDLVLAGVGFGCAFGTKWFGLTSVIATLVVWAAASLLARRRPARVLRDGAVLVALVAAGGGIWLVRNLVVSGNPVFPAKVAPLGITIFDAPRDQIREIAGQRILDYAGDGHAWTTYFLPAWKQALGLPGAVLAAGVILAALLAARRWTRRRERHESTYRVLVCVVAALVLGVVYLATPYTAFSDGHVPRFAAINVRYAEPALVLAAALAAWVAGRVGRWRPLVELAGLAAAVEGVHRGLGTTPGMLSKQAIIVILIAGAVVGAAVWLGPDRRRRVAPFALAAVGALLLGGVAYGRHFERRFENARYTTGDAVIAWITNRDPSGHRIGLAGYWDGRSLSPVFPAFGPRLGNDVAYVGPHIKGMLRSYQRRAGFVAALKRGRYDLLVVGRIHSGLPGAPQAPEFDAWARSIGWRRIALSPHFELYRAPAG